MCTQLCRIPPVCTYLTAAVYLDDRCWISKASRLHDNCIKRRAPRQQLVQNTYQVAAHCIPPWSRVGMCRPGCMVGFTVEADQARIMWSPSRSPSLQLLGEARVACARATHCTLQLTCAADAAIVLRGKSGPRVQAGEAGTLDSCSISLHSTMLLVNKAGAIGWLIPTISKISSRVSTTRPSSMPTCTETLNGLRGQKGAGRQLALGAPRPMQRLLRSSGRTPGCGRGQAAWMPAHCRALKRRCATQPWPSESIQRRLPRRTCERGEHGRTAVGPPVPPPPYGVFNDYQHTRRVARLSLTRFQ